MKSDAYYGKWRVHGRQVTRKLGPIRRPGTRTGLTRAQAEARLRALMAETSHPAPTERLTFEEMGRRYVQHLEEVMQRKRTTIGRRAASIFGWNDRAIVLANGEGNSTLNATVRGNTADTFDSINGLHGLHADLGILAADAGSVCLDAGGAVAADRNHLTLAGNEPQGGVDLRVRRASAVNLRMPGYAGGADDDAAVTTYLTGRNDVTTTAITSPGTGTYSGGGACPLP